MAIAVQFVGLLLGGAERLAGREDHRRQRDEGREAGGLAKGGAGGDHFSASRLTFSDRSSNSVLARWT